MGPRSECARQATRTERDQQLELAFVCALADRLSRCLCSEWQLARAPQRAGSINLDRGRANRFARPSAPVSLDTVSGSKRGPLFGARREPVRIVRASHLRAVVVIACDVGLGVFVMCHIARCLWRASSRVWCEEELYRGGCEWSRRLRVACARDDDDEFRRLESLKWARRRPLGAQPSHRPQQIRGHSERCQMRSLSAHSRPPPRSRLASQLTPCALAKLLSDALGRDFCQTKRQLSLESNRICPAPIFAAATPISSLVAGANRPEPIVSSVALVHSNQFPT